MDEKIFEKLEKHVFDEGNPWEHIWADGRRVPNKLPYFASWAIYDGAAEISSLEQFIRKNVESLKGNIVFVGLNFANPLENGWGPWFNIRNSNNVRWLLNGVRFSNIEKYKGAYITDIIKNYIGVDAQAVMRQVRQDPNLRKKNIELFFDEINILGSDNIEMYLFGNNVYEIFDKYVMRYGEKFNTFRKKVKKCQGIQHYSGNNNAGFRQFAPYQLGLTNSPEPDVTENERRRQIKILWDDLPPKPRPQAPLIKKK